MEELAKVLDMAFLQRLPPRNQVLDPTNPDHHVWIRAKRMNAKCYALLTTMVEGNQFISEFARLKQLYAADNVPKAACHYWSKLQEYIDQMRRQMMLRWGKP